MEEVTMQDLDIVSKNIVKNSWVNYNIVGRESSPYTYNLGKEI